MTHLYIELNTGLTEEVNSSIISKLYELAISGDLDNTSDLKGRLHSGVGYRYQVQYLTLQYPDLHITTDEYAIHFEDPNIVTYLNSIGVGSNGYITESQAAAATVVANSLNTTVTKFNELKYFTNITSSKNGITGSSSGVCRFYNWTALEEVDISNFVSLGHNSGNAYEDTFYKCSSLTKVIASDKLTDIGVHAFDGCSNLTTITGLSGEINVYSTAFAGCSSLNSDCFNDVTFNLYKTGNIGQFYNCSSILSITLSNSNTTIPQRCFESCTNLTSVAGVNNVTTVEQSAFYSCTNLETLDSSELTVIENSAFKNCNKLQTVSISNLCTFGNESFSGCNNLQTLDYLENIVLDGIGFNTFRDCNQLTFPLTITIRSTREEPSGNDSLWNLWLERGFLNCNLTNVVIDSSVKGIGYGAFANTGLTSIYAPDVLYISGWAFAGVNAEEIILPNVTKLMSVRSGTSNYHVFGDCPNLKKVILGHIDEIPLVNVYAKDRSWFYNDPMIETLDVGDSVLTININSRGAIFDHDGNPSFRKYIIRNTSVPLIVYMSGLSFEDYNTIIRNFGGLNNANAMIYVPDVALNDYKTALTWSIIADRIHPLSEIESN